MVFLKNNSLLTSRGLRSDLKQLSKLTLRQCFEKQNLLFTNSLIVMMLIVILVKQSITTIVFLILPPAYALPEVIDTGDGIMRM